MNRFARRAASSAAAFATLLALAAPAADAGEYNVFTCRLPSGAAAPTGDAAGGWKFASTPFSSSGLTGTDTCASGGALSAGIGGPNWLGGTQVSADWRFTAAPGTKITYAWLALLGYTAPTGSGKAGYLQVFSPAGEAEGFAARGDVAYHSVAWRPNTEDVTVSVRCLPGTSQCGGTSVGGDARMSLYQGVFNLEDAQGPVISSVTGDLDAPVWTGGKAVPFSATDVGGGIKDIELVVDGQTASRRVLDTNGGACQYTEGGFLTVRPCKLALSHTETIKTADFSDGSHDLAVRIIDVGGNAATVWSGRRVLDNRPPTQELPTVTGEARVGKALACNAQALAGQSPTLRYAWLRSLADGSGEQVIAGAEAQTYTLTDADAARKIRCRVTATDAGGSSTETSAITSGPFAAGAVVLGACEGLPTGPRDACGDFDGDGLRNADDQDADGDGVVREWDPDDFDAKATGRPSAPIVPSSPSQSTTTIVERTTTTTVPAAATSVPDGPAGEPNGKGATPAAVLSGSHVGTTSRTLHVAYGKKVPLSGKLLAPNGTPIEGARLEVLTQDRIPAAQFVAYTAVQTDANGVWRLTLPAGPSRTVRIAYRARFGDAQFAQTTDLTVLVKAGLQFRLSHKRLRNGKTVRYLGKLTGPRTGHRFVEVMVRSGAKWIVVCSVRTDSRGSFGCAHRFTKTFRRTRYVFRARVRRQSTLPYEPGVSASRALVVRPR
ncbi:hypothetical protein [Conexibacter sp. SYSU D00693]|uniref:hypothetical protein n=1 Tax=Conexibacter sp. SYSU D00693 TaxID=2812560 RepID=UPI00196A7417|nr:hypothetical protein [Conexibacter sp. SYSU D00693]